MSLVVHVPAKLSSFNYVNGGKSPIPWGRHFNRGAILKFPGRRRFFPFKSRTSSMRVRAQRRSTQRSARRSQSKVASTLAGTATSAAAGESSPPDHRQGLSGPPGACCAEGTNHLRGRHRASPSASGAHSNRAGERRGGIALLPCRASARGEYTREGNGGNCGNQLSYPPPILLVRIVVLVRISFICPHGAG